MLTRFFGVRGCAVPTPTTSWRPRNVFGNSCSKYSRRNRSTSTRSPSARRISNIDIAVIGTGISGLSATKELKELGFNVHTFEMYSDIGGVWNYANPYLGGYQQMTSNASSYLYAFTDFPFPTITETQSSFININKVYEHCRNYATHFELYPNIQFNSKVTKIELLSSNTNANANVNVNDNHGDNADTDTDRDQKWLVSVTQTSSADADADADADAQLPTQPQTTTHVFDRIVLCPGCFTKPRLPFNTNDIHTSIPTTLKNGMQVIHSQQVEHYIDSFENKNVVVVGCSISAVDLCDHALINNAKKVYHIVRQPRLIASSWEQPHNNSQSQRVNKAHKKDVDDEDKQYNFDKFLSARNISGFDPCSFAADLDDYTEYGYQPPRNPDTNEWSPDFGLAFCKAYPDFYKQGLIEFIHGDIDYDSLFLSTQNENENENAADAAVVSVRLKQTQKVRHISDIDIVILATGYDTQHAFASILPPDILPRIYKPELVAHKNLLYLTAFIPGYKHESIAFVGGNTWFSPYMYEMQARLVAQYWSGNCALPAQTEEAQWAWIQEHMIDNNPVWFGPYLVNAPYADQIAEVIGVLPTKDDYLQYGEEYGAVYEQLQTDRLLPAQFRLVGPGKHPKAMEWLMESIRIPEKESNTLQEQASRVARRRPSVGVTATKLKMELD